MIRHMPRHLGALVVSAALVSVASPVQAQHAAPKIAVVDVDLVVSASKAGQELQTKLNTFTQTIQTELEAKLEEVNGFRAQAAQSGDPSEIKRLQKAYEDGTIALKRLQDDRQRQGQKMQDEGLRAIEKSLAPVLKQIRDEQGLDLILARTPGIVLLVSERINITQTVIDRFNAQ